jgi:hypothetical protein
MVMAQLMPPYEGDDDDKGASVQALITRLGNADAAAQELWRDNYQLREQRRTSRAELADVKAKLPPDGAVILTKEQAADWDAYQKLGKPTDVEKTITDGKAAAEGLVKRDRADALGKAAKDLGYNPEVFTQLADMNKLTLTSNEVTMGDGKKQTVYTATPAGGQPMEMTQYASANWGIFMPSLTANAGGAGGQQQQGQQQQQQGGGGAQPWIGQGGGGAGGGGGQQGAVGGVADLAQKMVANRVGTGGNALQPGQTGQGQGTGQQGQIPGGPGAQQ